MFKPKAPTVTPTEIGAASKAPARAGFSVADYMRGLAEVDATRNKAKYWSAGIYDVSVMETFMMLSDRKDQRGHVKCGIICRIDTVHAAYPAEGTANASLIVGDLAGSFINLTSRGEYGLQDWKAILLALAKCEAPDLREEDISAEEWAEAYTLETPRDRFAGYKLRVDVARKRKDDAEGRPKIYDNPSWFPLGTGVGT